jgi:hypothetical protein
VQKVAKEGYILVTFVDQQYTPFALTWVQHCKALNLTSYIVGAMDDEVGRLGARAAAQRQPSGSPAAAQRAALTSPSRLPAHARRSSAPAPGVLHEGGGAPGRTGIAWRLCTRPRLGFELVGGTSLPWTPASLLPQALTELAKRGINTFSMASGERCATWEC